MSKLHLGQRSYNYDGVEHNDSLSAKNVKAIGGATEDKQDDIITNVGNIAMSITNAIDETAYDLNAAVFSEVTNISNDYIFDSIELNFSTAEAKTITITSSDGTILWGGAVDTSSDNLGYNTTAKHFNLVFDQGFNGGENITVVVTKFSSAGTMDCVLKVRQGSQTLTGNPVLGAGSETIGNVGIVGDVVETDDKTIRTEGYYPLIAQGKITGRTAWSKVGKILDPSDTNFEIISNIAVIHPGGIQCEVVSTDANDTIAGTGVQKILLEFYDSNWVYQTEVIEMDGTTPVNTVSTDMNRMECMSVYQVGTGNVAAGNITLKDTGAVNTFFQIDAKENFCPRCLHYIVPGSKSYVTDILVSSNTKEGVEFRLVVTVDNGVGTGGKVLIGKYATKVVDTDVPLHFNIPIEMDASNSTVGMGLFLAVKGVAANQEAFGSMIGYDEVT